MKRLLPILSIILLIAIQSQGQARNNPISDTTERIIKSYPNPAISFINLDIQKGFEKGFEIHVYNFLGKKVFESKNVAPKTSINLDGFTRGVYIFQLRKQNGQILESGKFQVSK